MYRNLYIQVINVWLPYCGYKSANRQIVPNNKSDIKIFDNKQGTWMTIEIAIPADKNVIKKETKKILKYKDLTIESNRI